MFAPLLLQHSPSFRCRRLSWLLSGLLLWLMALPVLATPEPSQPVPVSIQTASVPSQPVPASVQAEPVRVGVLATRGQDPARRQWQPLLDWLTQSVPGRHFALVPLELDGLAEAVAGEQLDFVITNPGQLVSLSRQFPLAWLATLRSPDGGDNLTIGAALVVRADAPFQGWQDLGRRRVPGGLRWLSRLPFRGLSARCVDR